MNQPAPSMCFWVHEGHVTACREENFLPFRTASAAPPKLTVPQVTPQVTPQDSWGSTLRTPWSPTVLQSAAPRPSPSLAIVNTSHNLFYLKCGHCLLHMMQLWHVGSTEAVDRIHVNFPDGKTPAPFLFEMIFEVLIAWAEAQLKLRHNWSWRYYRPFKAQSV